VSRVTESAPAEPVEALFLLGANVGDRAAALDHALDLLEVDCAPFSRSAVYETPPWGDLDQPPFLNVAARGLTRVAPLTLLRRCKEIEAQLGRTPTRQWGPREIDVDLLAYGRVSLTTPDLTLPHPRLHERAFALVPLAEIAPNWRHPLLDRTARELLAALPAADREAISRMDSGGR
jgi:2-amino-4-hydroxy-6-hydroxymethyldihydropteridine diphosphokinase